MGVITRDHIREGKHMLKRHMKVRGKHFSANGNEAREICENILSALWNGEYFHTSLGNYPGFYSRDFGMMIQPLLNLGYREEVKKTIMYALDKYEKQGGITTFINKHGKKKTVVPEEKLIDALKDEMKNL